MRSNSKLNKSAKLALIGMVAHAEAVSITVFHFPENGVTVALKPMGSGIDGAWAAVSVASPDEKKYHRKVGTFYALSRMDDGERIPLMGGVYDWDEGYARAFALAEVVGHPDWLDERDDVTGTLYAFQKDNSGD